MKIIKNVFKGLKKTKDNLYSKLNLIINNKNYDQDFLDNLEEALITSDISFNISEKIIKELSQVLKKDKAMSREEVIKHIKQILLNVIDKDFEEKNDDSPKAIMFVGVNGVGKTTTIGKFAYNNKNKKTLIVAADTFRAAAIDQLKFWSKKSNSRFISHDIGGDPSAVVYDAMTSAKTRGDDLVLIDTAGRLHNKEGLMKELAKIDRTISRVYPEINYLKYLVIDATTGQNGINQAKQFNEMIGIDGIILTKLDGASKGGIIISIIDELNIPVKYIGVGEGADDLHFFDPKKFIDSIL